MTPSKPVQRATQARSACRWPLQQLPRFNPQTVSGRLLYQAATTPTSAARTTRPLSVYPFCRSYQCRVLHDGPVHSCTHGMWQMNGLIDDYQITY